MSSILVDTNIWVEFFKSDSPVGDRLEKLLKTDSVWTCGIVIFELLQGVKSEKEKTTILDAMMNLEYIEMSKALWQKASKISTSLRKKGITIPVSDIFISAIAIEHKLQIFTLDKHFEEVQGVRLHDHTS